MDISTLIELYGLPGLIIGGLGWICLTLWRALQEAQGDRLAREREHSRELYDTLKTIDSFKALIERLAP